MADHGSMGPTSALNRASLAAAQEPLFQRMMQLCFLSHPYYQRVFRERRLRPGDFRRLADLDRLPLTQKSQLMAQPEDFRLRLEDVDGVSPEERNPRDLIFTTGSTSRPTPFYDSTHDHFSRIRQMTKTCEIAGVTPSDVVMNLFPLTSLLHQGMLSALWGTMGVGAKSVAALTGRPYPGFPVHRTVDDAVDMIETHRATVLWGIATYVRRVVIRAQERGTDLSSVRLILAMGEGCPTGMRADLRQRLQRLGARDVQILNGYGFTEMQGPAIECVEEGGFHLPTPTQYYFEILDPTTYEPLPEGQPGLVVLTHLNRRGTVLLRYVVGDITALSYETCPHCGRSEPRFISSPYRVGGLIKVKGTLVNPAAIHDELARLQPKGLLEYQMVLTKENAEDPYSADVLLVRLACREEDRDWLAGEVQGRVLQTAEVTPRLQFLPPDGFADQVQSYKFKRFVDERGTAAGVQHGR